MTEYKAQAFESLVEAAEKSVGKTETDDHVLNNTNRAVRAAKVIRQYQLEYDNITSAEEVISDFLSDLMHLCDGLTAGGDEDVEWDYLVSRADNCYTNETRGIL